MSLARSLRGGMLHAVLTACLITLSGSSLARAQGGAPATTTLPFTFKPGGYFKTDVIHDFDPIGSTDLFDTRTIPVDGSHGQNTRIHARQTRLSLDIRGPAEGRELRMYIETDFFDGTGYGLRLRHAYGTWGPLLAGQTWSNFVDELIIPNTINLDPPDAMPFLRDAQVRATVPIGRGGQGSIALEDPAHKLEIAANLNGKEEHAVPDLTGRLRWERPNSHVQLSGFLGWVGYRPVQGAVQNRALWSVSAAGRAALGEHDAVMGQVAYGDGAARYRGGAVGLVDSLGQLTVTTALGIVSTLEHTWSERYTSTIAYGWGRVDVPVERLGDPTHAVTYVSGNLLWWFLPKRAWVGAEYIYGLREVRSGASGSANRLQLAFKFIIP